MTVTGDVLQSTGVGVPKNEFGNVFLPHVLQDNAVRNYAMTSDNAFTLVVFGNRRQNGPANVRLPESSVPRVIPCLPPSEYRFKTHTVFFTHKAHVRDSGNVNAVKSGGHHLGQLGFARTTNNRLDVKRLDVIPNLLTDSLVYEKLPRDAEVFFES